MNLFALGALTKSAVVKQEGDEWVLYTKDGKRVLGRHPSAKAAYAQEYAIQKSQEREKSASLETRVAKAMTEAGVPRDCYFFSGNDGRATAYFGDWHEKEIWNKVNKIGRKFFGKYEEPDDSEIGRPEWATGKIQANKAKEKAEPATSTQCPCAKASDNNIYTCRCYTNPMIKSKGWEKSAGVLQLYGGVGLEKTAMRALTKFLGAMPKLLQPAAVAKLPTALRNESAYKLMGAQMAKSVTPLSNHGGHGAEHIFRVTRKTQKFLDPALNPLSTVADKRTGTLAALSHDIGRAYEDPVLSRANAALQAQVRGPGYINPNPMLPIGATADPATLRSLHRPITMPGDKAPRLQVSDLSPDTWHSETGGRWAKNFFDNSPYAKYHPNMRNDVRNAIRVHDTDAHEAFPEFAKRYLTQGEIQNPSAIWKHNSRNLPARALYLADKTDGLGAYGAVRTGQTGQQFGQTVQQSVDYAMKKNLPKYDRIINNFATPAQRPQLMADLGMYERSMQEMSRRNVVPQNVGEVNSWFPKAAAASDAYRKLFQAYLGSKITQEAVRRALRNAAISAGKTPPTRAMLDAVARMPKMPNGGEQMLKRIISNVNERSPAAEMGLSDFFPKAP